MRALYTGRKEIAYDIVLKSNRSPLVIGLYLPKFKTDQIIAVTFFWGQQYNLLLIHFIQNLLFKNTKIKTVVDYT